MADISKVTLLDGVTYDLKDGNAIPKPSGGTTGQVLTKTANGQEWATPSGGGSVDTVNGFSPDANKNVQTEMTLTDQEYEALTEEEKTNGMTYFLPEGGGYTPNSAASMTYDNTRSNLAADNVQDAIDEVVAAGAEIANVTLYAANWNTTTNTYVVSDPRVFTDSVQNVLPAEGITDSQLEALQAANLQDYGQTDGSFTIKAYGTVPSIDIPIRVIFHRGVHLAEVEQDEQIDVYTTEERVVGTWIDGKPIYRRVFTGTSWTVDSYIDTGIGENVIDKVVKIYGVAVNGTTDMFQFPYYDVNFHITAYYVSSSRTIRKRGTSNSVSYFALVFEYTKSADSGA